MRNLLTGLLFLCLALNAFAEDGYRLWLRYDKVKDEKLLTQYQSRIKNIYLPGSSATVAVMKTELSMALKGLLGKEVPFTDKISSGTLVIKIAVIGIAVPESFSISTGKDQNITISSPDDAGLLYGMFHFLRLLQTHTDISKISIAESPKIKTRILNHWDNLDRTVERGYAGFSIWDWHRLPEYVDPRYTDYARANASIGINAVSLTNVNANALLITPAYLEKVKVLADLFRPYNIKVFLTARFSAPMEIGGFKTADPLDADVRQWWKTKTDEIYKYVPDFGGFLVKANSEGQPGPQNYNRTHADGANMLAEAVKPHGGIVMWRAFVYDSNVPDDRAKQAYSEFKPLDGKFNDNVIIQVKNGPIDFQPREPYHPLFGAMKSTPLMMELQITQEYLGQATHLVFLPVLWKENILQADLKESNALTAIAGVANIGNDRNWTGHLFGQANWYGFGRLAWNYEISPEQISSEWIGMTLSTKPDFVKSWSKTMNSSHEMAVKYMTPLGLHHIMGANHHYGPGPWVSKMSRADWTSTYYHKADSIGIGFDRTATGSNALAQYPQAYQDRWKKIDTCPEELLLWFHHVSWDHKMSSNLTLWEELCRQYDLGLTMVGITGKMWDMSKPEVDEERFNHVRMLLDRQEKEAELWHHSCILYFQTFSKRPIPDGINVGDKPLEYYINLQYPYAPGIRPRW
ncbi:MAG TPA: alpha-glucuronidase family glycosyl hydrolase [Cyclobacteriaceae bacterium]|nr:alpha-glucuronidase family glycosyl hydrolase [Cyclobacteriaceae bacterium]